MLLPEPMSKILVVGTKDGCQATIDSCMALRMSTSWISLADEEGFILGLASRCCLGRLSQASEAAFDGEGPRGRRRQVKEKIPRARSLPALDASTR